MIRTVRASILDLVRRFPALHGREIERQLALPSRLAAYHLANLERDGLVKRVEGRGHVRFYATDSEFTRAEVRLHRILRRPQAYAIALRLLEREETTPGDLVAELHLAKATVSYHLRLLERAGLVAVRPAGRSRIYRLRQPGRVRGLIRELPPPPRRPDDFAALWEDLVG